MHERLATPQDLVEGLQARRPDARARLWQLLREPLARLMGELIQRHGLEDDRDLLTSHALHAIETSLRARPASAFADVGWNAFRASNLLAVARLIATPHGANAGSLGPPPLPDARAYHSDTFFRPYTRLGNQFFGGDWYAGRVMDDAMWVFVADVTGHGYFAYLLATALPAVWQHCWNAHPGRAPQPAELLKEMHEQLSDSLPEGIFLECTLVKLDGEGGAVVCPAGGTRLLVRRHRRNSELIKLRGAWLGLAAPTVEEQHSLTLQQGDELILATDGAFDQLEDETDELARILPPDDSLFDSMRGRLERSLAQSPQRDDITLVLLKRRESAPVVLKLPSNRAGDVPV